MKYLKVLSIAAIVFSVAVITSMFYSSNSTASFDSVTYGQNASNLDSSLAITNYDTKLLKDIIVDSAKQIASSAIDRLKSKIETVTIENSKTGATFQMQKDVAKNKDDNVFWAKVIFSGIFCFAALFVVLSKSYDDETKKWAFSVLTLIAGVWIGIATK